MTIYKLSLLVALVSTVVSCSSSSLPQGITGSTGARLASTPTAPSFQAIYSFPGGVRGKNPLSVLLGPNGSIYAATLDGGQGCESQARKIGCGVIVRVRAAGAGFDEKTIHMFRDDRNGAGPVGIILGPDGSIYGTTEFTWPNGCGTLFSIDRAGSAYAYRTVYRFQGYLGDACAPGTPPIIAGNGSIYGTTKVGGAYGFGTVYRIAKTKQGAVARVLYSFQGKSLGAVPNALTFDAHGNLYGEAAAGASDASSVIFELERKAGSYRYKVIRSFPHTALSGRLILGRSGELFGTIGFSVDLPCGAVFAFEPSGGAYHEIYRFSGGATGCLPSGLALAPSGALVGTTSEGGSSGGHCGNGGCGTIFELTPKADGAYEWRLLHTFDGPDGKYPDIWVSRGNAFYGSTNAGGLLSCPDAAGQGCGTIYRIVLSSTSG